MADNAYPRVTEKRNGERFEVTVEFGRNSEDLVFALGQSVALVLIVLIWFPDFALMQRGELFEYFKLLMLCLGVTVAGVVVGYCFVPKAPAVLRFSPSGVGFDSGRPNLVHLVRAAGKSSTRLAQLLFARRQRWAVDRKDLPCGAKRSKQHGVAMAPGYTCHRVRGSGRLDTWFPGTDVPGFNMPPLCGSGGTGGAAEESGPWRGRCRPSGAELAD